MRDQVGSIPEKFIKIILLDNKTNAAFDKETFETKLRVSNAQPCLFNTISFSDRLSIL